MNLFDAAANNLFKTSLKLALKSEIIEIKQSVQLSELQIKAAILKLELTYQKKVNQSKFYLF
ncbi:hypothetical protein [Polaribacter glomeratus]|uniref:Uncharacterized protein n=1 Tax=Polaribacter glomeratus TaxID=102 RepID=A0A2S7WUW1_9FLAO|nr:hypothetical protein [Polaribacter glomeratus]PQJ81394.1 hypothetical protein BTO16_01840 [Polaribacter glomeratus]TXD64807.1 hypothetical protein ESX12_13400 [Polaribacter glomeratus]